MVGRFSLKGTVKWFSQEKGYGFITSEEGQDHYFNVRSVQGAELPSNGDKVEFISKPGDKGPKAFDVNISEKASSSHRNNRQDDRINCPNCNKKIVPRMITYRGQPEKSVCPYCAATVKTFSKCFIATSVYGDPCCEQVRELRRFRDTKLQTNYLGRGFIKAYYSVSPPIADWLKTKPAISSAIRKVLDKVVTAVKAW